MITLADYWMGRDVKYRDSLTPEIEENAEETVRRVNRMLDWMERDEVPLELNERHSLIASGWRPPTVNANTPNAAQRSKHMVAEACDLHDPEGQLDDWCDANEDKLAEIGLWREHPSATKGWLHVQIVSPRSGKRTFYP